MVSAAACAPLIALIGPSKIDCSEAYPCDMIGMGAGGPMSQLQHSDEALALRT